MIEERAIDLVVAKDRVRLVAAMCSVPLSTGRSEARGNPELQPPSEPCRVLAHRMWRIH